MCYPQNFEHTNKFLFDTTLTNHAILTSNSNLVLILFLSALFFASCILISRNPIYALVSLVATFLSIILSFLLLHVEFIALTFLIIYIGAISILFLFVIMMFNIKQNTNFILSFERFYIILATYLFIPKCFMILLTYVNQYVFSTKINILFKENFASDYIYNYKKINLIFKYKKNDIFIYTDFLYDNYTFVLFLVGVILLCAMIVSIFLALESANFLKK